ncbi:unnamed protein product [Auanema sp. JU1783]|nr:unnamed protein product [Auanema sp. JU1783]
MWLPTSAIYLAIACLVAQAEAAAETCEHGTGFLVMENTVLDSVNSITYEDLTEDECVKVCSDNRDKFGREVACSSTHYNHATFACTIYTEKSSPAGTAQRAVTTGSKYFEKFCFEEKTSLACQNGMFIRIDDYVLAGFAIEVSLHDTIEGCVTHCVSNSTCKSAMYFYEEKECIINTETALSYPDSFRKEENDKVIYFQNSCTDNVRQEESFNGQIDADTVLSNETPEGSGFESEEDESFEVSNEKEREGEGEDEIENEDVTLSDRDQLESEIAEVFETTQKTIEENQETTGNLVNEDVDESVETSDSSFEPESELVERPKKKYAVENAIRIKYRKHPKSFAAQTEQFSNEIIEKKLKKNSLKGKEKKPIETFVEPISAELEKIEEPVSYFTEWSDWTMCTKMGERQLRRRQCTNLKKCVGPLMEFRSCEQVTVPEKKEVNKPIQSVRSLVGVGSNQFVDSHPIAEVIENPNGTNSFWGPWLGQCQEFASAQPCNNGKMIGFESRECIAEDPAQCVGPFFRYCNIMC